MESENQQRAAIAYAAGQEAFERGQYREAIQQLETAVGLSNPRSMDGGAMQIWLVTAYEAAGHQEAAISLCRSLSQHPDWQTRKESQRLLYILEAPKLKTRPEWLSEIPDLGSIQDGDGREPGQSKYQVARSVTSQDQDLELEDLDLSPMGTQDTPFIWVALGATILVLGGLLWLS